MYSTFLRVSWSMTGVGVYIYASQLIVYCVRNGTDPNMGRGEICDVSL